MNEFALSHVLGPMANSVQSTWHQYLRRLATYTCLCFGLAGAREIGETSYTFSDMEWLRIYNAAVKRGGMLHQNYYLSVGSMTVMINLNDEAQATDRNYGKWRRGLQSGIRGTIVERPMVRKENDELAGKFRFGKTILITDLVCKCNSNARGMTNIQYGLDEMGYAVTVIDINSFKSVTRAQKFLDAVDHLKRNVMPDVAAEENVTIHCWISFAFLITDAPISCVGRKQLRRKNVRGNPKRRQDGHKTDLCVALQGSEIPRHTIWYPGSGSGFGRRPEELRDHGHD